MFFFKMGVKFYFLAKKIVADRWPAPCDPTHIFAAAATYIAESVVNHRGCRARVFCKRQKKKIQSLVHCLCWIHSDSKFLPRDIVVIHCAGRGKADEERFPIIVLKIWIYSRRKVPSLLGRIEWKNHETILPKQQIYPAAGRCGGPFFYCPAQHQIFFSDFIFGIIELLLLLLLQRGAAWMCQTYHLMTQCEQ